ncbi:MAG: ATP-binding cassette domain-containing protein [Acidobacteria bacterium]|nr:ATP-binding cassette domain-containing protein [Acidobacteriota bacterium]MBK8315383.1 ATP-binding cassette domain-containing protein [Acidobacteriota bacterium]
MTIAELHNVTHNFSDKRVLANVSLSFLKNRITALLGSSGSGKSTILKIINGMVRPDSGTVRVFGEDFDYQNPARLRLKTGYAVQNIGLFPHLNIQENIALLGKITGRPSTFIQERTAFLLSAVQLPDSYLKKYPYQLSGGEQQRVGLCRAFFLQPPLVLMDEPFASLDYKTKANIYEYLLRLQAQEPTSVIIVTHQLEEAELLADEFVWINEGKVFKQGGKAELDQIKYEFKEQHR